MYYTPIITVLPVISKSPPTACRQSTFVVDDHESEKALHPRHDKSRDRFDAGYLATWKQCSHFARGCTPRDYERKTTMSDPSGDGSHVYIWELHLGPGKEKEAGRELVMSSRSSTLQSMGHQYSTFPTIWQYVAASRIREGTVKLSSEGSSRQL